VERPTYAATAGQTRNFVMVITPDLRFIH
jgi:hypothetical protein